jgi:predicted TIM-barrel fold metal-dependent hydrolase
MIFDIHTHIGENRFGDKPWTAETVLKIMDDWSIDGAILLPSISTGKYISAQKLSEEVNKAPDRLVGFILVNPNDPNAVNDLENAVVQYGAKGLKIHPAHMGVPADDEKRVYPLLEKAQELKIPVMFHSGETPYSTPWQVGLAALDFPKVTIIMEHMGFDSVALTDGAIKMAKKAENIILGTTGVIYDFTITKAVQTIGSDRIVFGTETPINHPMVEIQKIRVAKISEEDKEKILGKNIMRILGL